MKRYFIIVALLFFLLIVGCTASVQQNKTLSPKAVVELYFTSWNNQEYETMYTLISDGFKTVEPTAKTVNDFKTYAQAQGITAVRVESIQEKSNDETTATVDYKVVFVIKNKEVPFEGTYTVKNKKRDANPGWKLIHPYGEHIDTS